MLFIATIWIRDDLGNLTNSVPESFIMAKILMQKFVYHNPVQGKRYRKNTAKESVMQGICSTFCKIDILFARQCVPLLLTIYE